MDILGWVRALWGCINVPAFHWQNLEECFKTLNPALIVTDCKSLYDLVTRTATPSCEEFRTTLEVLLIKQRCQENAVFRWIPTTLMLADGLTKPMDSTFMRIILSRGRFKLHAEPGDADRCTHRKRVLEWLKEPSRSARPQCPDDTSAS